MRPRIGLDHLRRMEVEARGPEQARGSELRILKQIRARHERAEEDKKWERGGRHDLLCRAMLGVVILVFIPVGRIACNELAERESVVQEYDDNVAETEAESWEKRLERFRIHAGEFQGPKSEGELESLILHGEP